jgi:type I restriction enzyme R subunit
MGVNPKYYEKMSELLDALIAQRKREALDYKAYLAKIVSLAKQVSTQESQIYPLAVNTPSRRALYDNLKDVAGLEWIAIRRDRVADSSGDHAERVALAVDREIRAVKKDGWRENRFKLLEVRNAIRSVLENVDLSDRILEIAKHQRDY